MDQEIEQHNPAGRQLEEWHPDATMLPLNKQVTNLKYSRRLFTLGLPQNTLFYWARLPWGEDRSWTLIPRTLLAQHPVADKFAAYTASELSILWPPKREDGKPYPLPWKLKVNWYSDINMHEAQDTLVEAMAQVLVKFYTQTALPPGPRPENADEIDALLEAGHE